MPLINISLSINSNTDPKHLISQLIASFRHEELVGFKMDTEPVTVTESPVEDAPRKETPPNTSDNKSKKVDWKDVDLQTDLLTMSQVEFCKKYPASKGTFYLQRGKLRKVLIDGKQMYEILRDPEAYAKENGISDKEMDTKIQICRSLYKEKYSEKYPGIFKFAGKFPDKVVGGRYSISGSTVCVLRKLMGIPKYKKEANE